MLDGEITGDLGTTNGRHGNSRLDRLGPFGTVSMKLRLKKMICKCLFYIDSYRVLTIVRVSLADELITYAPQSDSQAERSALASASA